MNFPHTNKYKNPNAPVEAQLGDNIKLLEERLSQVNFRLLMRYYWAIFGVITLSVGVFLFIIRLVFAIKL